MPFYRMRAARQGHWSSVIWTITVSTMKSGVILTCSAILLAGCGQWPDIDAPAQSDDDPWPVLLPLGDLSSQSSSQSSAQSEAQRLSARAAALRSRARIMRTSVPDLDAVDALRARLAR